MPDFVTHHLFGDTLEPPEAAKQFPVLYRFGLQGPDLLFFRKVLSGAPLAKLGSTMHELHTARLFESMSSYCRGLHGTAQTMTEAYICGFAAHYCLDSTVHPYVFAHQRRLELLHPEQSDSGVHGSIECDIDMDIYSSVHHASATQFRPSDYYTLDSNQGKALGALYTHLLYDVYSTLVSPREVIASAQDTLIFQKLLFSGNKLLLTAAELLDNTKGKGSRYYSSHLKGRAPQWDSLNLSHVEWSNPWTNEKQSYSVHDLFELAAERYSRLVSVLCRNIGGALLAIPVELDFSGRQI